MIQTVIQPHELGAVMRDRIAALMCLKAHGLSSAWVTKYDIPKLMACCDRIAAHLPDMKFPCNQIQRELIENPDFAPWYARLLALNEQMPEGETQEAAPVKLDGKELVTGLSELLETSWENELPITAYTENDVLAALIQGQLSSSAQLAYLAGRAPMDLFHGPGAQLAENLAVCGDIPVPLDDAQWALMEEPFVATRCLFTWVPFEKIAELFRFCPTLADIARLLHQEDVPEELRMEDYMYFAEDGPEYLRLLNCVIHRLGGQATGAFICQWQKDGCALSQLQRMERRLRAGDDLDWCASLATYGGYINLLYGTRFKSLSLTELDPYQESILTYAIIHNKKHFIRIVDENGELFLNLPSRSILFRQELYQKHFNLNELTANDLADCAWMMERKLPQKLFEGDRQYTFAELKLLYDTPAAYAALYAMLRSGSLDYRIRVLRQLRKRNVLSEIADEGDLPVLAALLDQKPLHDWRREELGHIQDLTAADTAKMLIHLEKMRHLLPSMSSRTDAMLALRSLENIHQFDSMDQLKDSLFETDKYWRALADDMGLTPEFKTRHRDAIVEFLCRDGAGIAWSYREELKDDQRTSFHRVVKAELMGRFHALKYYEGDLARELDSPVSPELDAAWQRNLSAEGRGMEVREQDDFFATMLLGTQPYRTCLSYLGGAYCKCLLACFDSNKKVLYASLDGHIIGRACIRLTKCRLSGSGQKGGGGFHFADLEDDRKDERIALFLERPYVSGACPEEQQQIKTMFIDLVRQKARELGTMLVLSMDYADVQTEDFAQTVLNLYISASKAGEQYLDSLGGNASVSSEGRYRSNNFLVWQSAGLG